MDRYLDDSVKPYRPPRFLLNDVVRYWRTICVDFAGKEREGPEKWGLRNAKLRTSRKVLFAGGLIPVLECFRFDREPMREFIERQLDLPPTDRIAQAFLENGATDEGGRTLGAYDEFTGRMNDQEFRQTMPEPRCLRRCRAQAAVEKGRYGVGKRSFAAVSAVVLAFTALAAPLVQAEAEEVTRESYKEAVEPICKVNTKANERILKGARAKVRKGKLQAASKQFFRASTALRKTVKELKAVPQPPADEAKLAKWLKTVGEEATLFQKTGKKLKAGNKNGALQMVIRLEHNANVANNQVLGFEFHYCRFEPSKFT